MARAYDRILKVARPVAHLEDSAQLEPKQIADVIQYRSSLQGIVRSGVQGDFGVLSATVRRAKKMIPKEILDLHPVSVYIYVFQGHPEAPGSPWVAAASRAKSRKSSILDVRWRIYSSELSPYSFTNCLESVI